MKKADLHWLSGLLEGEGCFSSDLVKGRRRRYPLIVVQMTDRDVVERVAALFGVSCQGPYWDRKSTVPYYRAKATGARAIALMRLLSPLMGARRCVRIAGLIAESDLVDAKG
jgi:hypothetical protein